MSHYSNSVLPELMRDDRQDDGWREDEADYAKHEFARVAALAARLGRCPERARDIETGLCEVAGINEFHLAS